MNREVTIVGGGLSGAEAAWQLARRGVPARLYEMRPAATTPAHATDLLAELVCSNSLKSEQAATASGLLKQELRLLGSLLMQVADEVKIPAGHALAVDRGRFSMQVTERILSEPLIQVVRQEMPSLPLEGIVIIASGPLTSEPLSQSIAQFTGSQHLYFYDSISPIVDAATIDHTILFPASRYDKGGEDYLNAAMSSAEYLRFYEALAGAESAPWHRFEKPIYFEGCLPIEELARRGVDTLRFGPMKPVGLVDPRTGRRPYAAVQLRLESDMADSYNLVGFQNHLKFSEQLRVFRMIPGLENAEFLRFGQMHRNTFIASPRLLLPTLQARTRPDLLFAGQICGIEGYVESIATGLLAGIAASRLARSLEPGTPPRTTACGSLVHHIAFSNPDRFQPANISFGLLPDAAPELKAIVRNRKERHHVQVAQALEAMTHWIASMEPARTETAAL
jgi:methylenetetrahydrofolate--tRNA-(uracil-5-)-methyltransferase